MVEILVNESQFINSNSLGFLRRPQNLKKIFVILLTRVSCSVHSTVYLSKSRRRFFKTNVVKSYYINFNSFSNFHELQQKTERPLIN